MAKSIIDQMNAIKKTEEFEVSPPSRRTVGYIPKSELDPCMQTKLFDWPECIGPSSEVINDVTNWADAGILIPHEMIRWYHAQIRHVFEKFKPHESGNEWMIDAFFGWLEKYYVPNIHHHHDAEEKIYFPAIKAAQEAKGLTYKGAFVNTQHVDLVKSLEGIAPFRQKVTDGGPVAVDEFQRYMNDYMADMDQHLKQEEEFTPEALRSCMTEEEEAKVVQKILKSLSLNDHKGMLPAIIYAMCKWGGVREVSKMMANLPPPVKVLFKHWFDIDFYYNQLAVLKGLAQGVQPVVRPGCCCVVL